MRILVVLEQPVSDRLNGHEPRRHRLVDERSVGPPAERIAEVSHKNKKKAMTQIQNRYNKHMCYGFTYVEVGTRKK